MGIQLSRIIFKKIRIVRALMIICLIVAVYSFWLPTIRVIVSPVGSTAWSIHDVVKVIPKGIFQPAQKPKSKANFDFVDLLMKIIPTDSKTQLPKKISLPFIYLMLVPIAFVLVYLGVCLQFLILFFGKSPLLQKISGGTALSALYALIGTYYLGIQAKITFTAAVEKASQGAFGFVSKYLVGQIAVSADQGVYLLLFTTTFAFFISLFWKRP